MIVAILVNAKDVQKRRRIPTAALFVHSKTQNVLRVSSAAMSVKLRIKYEEGFSFTAPDMMRGSIERSCEGKNLVSFLKIIGDYYANAGFQVKVINMDGPVRGQVKLTEDLSITENDDESVEMLILKE